MAVRSVPEPGQQRIRIRYPETRRWRTYDVDESLDPTLLQRLNDAAFLHGLEVVSTCAGHERRYGIPVIDREYLVADARLGVFYPVARRFEEQRARVCLEIVAEAIVGASTEVVTSHGDPVEMWPGPDGRFGRSLLIARHVRPTHEDPAAAALWWATIVDRLQRSAHRMVNVRQTRRPRAAACEIDDCLVGPRS